MDSTELGVVGITSGDIGRHNHKVGDIIRLIFRNQDPAADDVSLLTLGAVNTVDYDFSSIVPQNATWVYLRLTINDGVTSWVRFCHTSSVNKIERFMVRLMVANVWQEWQGLVPLDSSRKVEISSDVNFNAWTTLNMTVLGWIV